jgi:hypothetical protein
MHCENGVQRCGSGGVVVAAVGTGLGCLRAVDTDGTYH